MVDNIAAKSHLNNAESNLNNLDNVSNINALISARSLDLYRNLASNNLFLDTSLKNTIVSIRDRLQTPNLVNDAQTKITELETERAGLPTGTGGNTRRAEIGNEISKLHGIVTTGGVATGNVTNRLNEYNTLSSCSNLFDLNSSLGDLDINTAGGGIRAIPLTPFGTGGTALAPYTFGGTIITPRYSLCDEEGNQIKPEGGNYKITIGGVEYTIGGVHFAGGNLDCSTITLNPPLQNSPQEITLSINASYNNVIRDVNVVCNKKFKLKLNDGTFPLNAGQRDTQFENYNTMLPDGHKISNTIETSFTKNRYKLERTAIEHILQKNGGIKYNTLNEKQKEEFYQTIRNIILPGGTDPYFDRVYRTENINNNINRYSRYKIRFTEDGKDWNKGDNIKSMAKYTTFIHNNVAEKLDDFFISKLEHYMGTPTEEMRLKGELTKFLNNIEKNKIDNNVNNDIDTDVSDISHQMDIGPRHLLHNRDTNYMRFFSGSSTSLKGEKVNIYTNTKPDYIDNPEPVKYDMDLKITSRNNISVDIKIEGTNEVISHKSGEPSALVRKIMRDQRIKYGKARAHIGFNIYKSMIKLAKEKDISLQYRDSSDHTRFIDIENGNIVVRQIDNLTTLAKEDGEIIFDQEKFINMNQFDNTGSNGALRQGLDVMGIHFNHAMNTLHRQYREGTERRFLGIINSKNKFRLPTSFWQSPIKKILNMRDNLNFDFSTNVNSGGKNIKIDFEKNKFTINMEGLKEPISSKDLGKLLNHREHRIRSFDGKEREIAEAIYVALISKLRENSKINRTDFGVMDNTTGNMYVLDEDGEFGMITKEDLNTYANPLKSKNKDFGSLDKTRLSGITVRKLTTTETKELLKNPFLMQKLIKAMNHRLG